MRATTRWLAALMLTFAGAAFAQNPCGDCRAEALARHKACNAAAKESPAFEACGKQMSASMQACQVGACAKDVAKIYEGYCAGCMQQAGDNPGKRRACEDSVCKKAAGK
ncbi:MAG TPA: hypothetical protein VM073_00640 [Usitatibacter sp.]|nr:hypothetical protein [Usitatibacter sp.]